MADSSLVVNKNDDHTNILLLYVNDIFLIDDSPTLLDDLILTISCNFSMKDLRSLHFFFGIEVHHTSENLYSSQSKYACDILNHAHMHSCKPLRTSLATKSMMIKGVIDPYLDVT